jgi:very-short-patch-repair endonuclease
MELWRKAKRRNVVPDLYWQEYGLAVEFFGEDFHTGTEHEDMERQETEQDMGLKVVTFWKEDVLDLRRFRAKADSIAHYLGMRLPEASDQFLAAQAKLQQMLVRHQRWI